MWSRSANDGTSPRELAHSQLAVNIRGGARLCDQLDSPASRDGLSGCDFACVAGVHCLETLGVRV